MRSLLWHHLRSIAVLSGMLAAGSVHAGGTPAPVTRPVVLELYTSQGCSSCPPAEALLTQLADRAGILALAFHVDYWDGLGWRDPYSLAGATGRQSAWARAHDTQDIYTPQLIVDGRRSVLGSDAAAVETELQLAGQRARQAKASGLAATIAGGELRIDAPGTGDSTVYDVYGIAFLAQATTRIERGENAGRTIRQRNVVRSVVRLGSIAGKGAQLRVALTAFPADASELAIVLQDATSAAVEDALVLELR